MPSSTLKADMIMTDADIFTPVATDTKERLADRVADQITQLIVEKQLRPGTKLPNEFKLAESIGVSRTVVREAIKILIAKGLVETRHGFGTFVRQMDDQYFSQHLSMLMRLNSQTIEHLHQVRSILEVEVAAIAASQATDEEITELDQYLEQMESLAEDPVAYARVDGEFHRCLARIAHNPLLVMLLDSVSSLLYEVRLAVSQYPDLYERTLQDHRLIVHHVRAHSASGARQAMSDHLKYAREIQLAVEAQTKDQTHRS
jgi:GntR family transcriptional repressor for pyruvate dehydrogenase complex